MKLVYKETGEPVRLGDKVRVGDRYLKIGYFAKPHKPDSSGKITLYKLKGSEFAAEYYVSVIGAEWIEREDRSDWS